MHKPIISVNNLSKQFRIKGNKKLFAGLFDPQWQYKDAVKQVSLTVREGEAVAFLGPNGAGKTTTTKMLTGLVHPTGGDLQVLGYTPFERNYDFLRRIGLVMGNKAGLNWDLSARQSYDLLQKVYEIPAQTYATRVGELTKLLQVEHVLDTQVRKLSLGERMKLELIGAILHDPDILFLDEPTIGLDIDSKKSVREFLRHLHKNGKTLLLTSHDMDDIAAVCERAIVINHGRIIYDDAMAHLTNHYSDIRYARLEFINTVPAADFVASFGTLVSQHGNVIVLAAKKQVIMQAATKISDAFPLQDIAIEPVPLEVIISDVFKKTG